MSAEAWCACGCHDGRISHLDGRCPCATVGPSSCLVCRQGLHAHEVYGLELWCDARRRQAVEEHRRRTAGTRQAAEEYSASLPVQTAIAAARARREASPPAPCQPVVTAADAAAAVERIRCRVRRLQAQPIPRTRGIARRV